MNMNFRVAMEAHAGHGQDAAISGERFAFVLDGLGGAGGKTREHRDGRKWMESKIAARTAAKAAGQAVESRWENWAQILGNASIANVNTVIEQIRNELKWAIDGALQQAAREWQATTLPTTFAGWITFPQPDGNTLALAVWAGDSRCYTMDDECMKLCTTDDVDDRYREDAMQELLGSGSAPMNNRLGIDGTYHLNVRARRIKQRTLLLCCTDGVYGSMPSPMHMEFYLRLLSGEESLSDMAVAWEALFENNSFLQDDAATLETMFIDPAAEDEESRLQSLRNMLEASVDRLEKEYIEAFPDAIEDETVDIDGRIGSLARQMCKRSFHGRLRKNAVEIVKKGKEYPSDLPCAGVLRRMQADYREMVEDKRDELKRKAQQAQRELDDYVAGLDVGEMETYREPAELDPKAAGWIRSNQAFTFLEKVKGLFYKIVTDMQNCYSPGMDYGMRRGDSIFDGMRRGDTGFNPDDIGNLDSILKDLCIFVNEHFNGVPRGDGRARFKMIYTGREKVRRCRGRLSREDQENLKQMVRNVVEIGETVDESLFENKSWAVAEVANVVILTQRLVNAERELSRFERSPYADGDPSTAVLDDYLKSHINDDARYFVAEWVKEKRKPSYFSLAEKDLLTISREVDELIKSVEGNGNIRQKYEQRKQQIMALWEQYKPGYEAWNELLEELTIAEELPETEPAAVDTTQPGEIQPETQPVVEEAAESVVEADGEAGDSEAADAEWTDCDSVEIHE